VLEIERISWLRRRYAVHDDRGSRGVWTRRRFEEAMTGELDGEQYEFGRAGRKHFSLMHAGRVLAAADSAGRGRWTIAVADAAYELRRASGWRSVMELRHGDAAIGSIRKGKAARGTVVCELPAELSPAAQTFIGFVVVTLWNRAAASSGTAAVASTASGT
jgi:hypothetical protein